MVAEPVEVYPVSKHYHHPGCHSCESRNLRQNPVTEVAVVVTEPLEGLEAPKQVPSKTLNNKHYRLRTKHHAHTPY